MGKVLLTGASGFIGAHVRKVLSDAGEEFVSLMRAPKPDMAAYPGELIVTGSLADIGELEYELTGVGIDACVHLAWEGIPDYSADFCMNNMEYGFNALRLCKLLGIKRLVMAGSCWEYLNPQGAVKEDAPLSYENPFKAAKNTLHIMAKDFCEKNGIALHWLRFFYVYGEGQREGSLIPYIVNSLKKGDRPTLNGAFNRNDFIHVSDVANAVLLSLKRMREHSAYGVFNIGSGKAERVLDIAGTAADMLNVPFDASLYEAPETVPTGFRADITAAQNELGWAPQVDICEGIERYIKIEN